MVPKVQIAPDLAFPIEAVTQTFAFIAKRGAGKTYAAAVMAEQMLKAGAQVVILDPVGVWWGLRSSADGETEGLPIIIFGSDRKRNQRSHVDVYINADMGARIATLLTEERLSAVIDLSGFRISERTKFVTDFAEELFYRNTSPLHLILDEADAFAPQVTSRKGDVQMLAAIEDIVRQGRNLGFGVTLITQRCAVISKDVLTQIEVLVALRTIGKPDIKTINDWVSVYAEDAQRKELVESLPKLPIGTAWVWSPGWLDLFQKVKINQRITYDSSSTPAVGMTRVEPRALASVDIERIRELLAPPKEKAPAVAASDNGKATEIIATLRRQISDLKVELDRRQEPVRVEVPVISDETVTRLEELANQAIEYGHALIDFGSNALNNVQAAIKQQERSMTMRPVIAKASYPKSAPRREGDILLKGAGTNVPDDDPSLPSGALRILRAIAQRYPTRLTRAQVGTLSGFAYKGGTFNNYLSMLRKRGLIEESDGSMTVTAAAFDLLGDSIPDAPSTTAELIDMWSSALPGGAATMLSFLADNYPNWFSRESLGEATGYTASGGTFGNYMSMLRRNGLIEEQGRDVRANAALMMNIPA